MFKELLKKVTEKIENEKMLIIGIELAGNHELNRILPEKINTDHGIYIEGEIYILNISDKEKYDIFLNLVRYCIKKVFRKQQLPHH